jgi:hypothetical protein
MLWQRSLVMRDLETKSLWSHLLGKAMQGSLKGTSLPMLPASMTTWGEWKQRHPDTTLLALPRTAKRFRESIWEKPEKFVYGITPHVGSTPVSVGMPLLQKKKLVQTTAQEKFLLFTFLETGKSAQAFSRIIDGKPLDFRLGAQKGSMLDTGTQSTWHLATGACTKGKLTGKHLKVLPGTVSYKHAWKTFFPDGMMIE